jgi:hypothetical protein
VLAIGLNPRWLMLIAHWFSSDMDQKATGRAGWIDLMIIWQVRMMIVNIISNEVNNMHPSHHIISYRIKLITDVWLYKNSQKERKPNNQRLSQLWIRKHRGESCFFCQQIDHYSSILVSFPLRTQCTWLAKMNDQTLLLSIF